MCGLVGVFASNNREFPQQKFLQLMHEASIRGRHATGVSWSDGANIFTKSESCPEDQFEYPDLDGAIGMIGHCRYTTSYAGFNQPIHINELDENFAIVHNGVVTQALPEEWEGKFGYRCKGLNDSELLARALQAGKHPLLEFPESSQACIVLERERLRFWRNEQRPIWFLKREEALYVSSTADIIERVFNEAASPCLYGLEFSFDGDNFMIESLPMKVTEDLQNAI